MLEKGDKNFEMLPQEIKDATANEADRFRAVMQYIEDNVRQYIFWQYFKKNYFR